LRAVAESNESNSTANDVLRPSRSKRGCCMMLHAEILYIFELFVAISCHFTHSRCATTESSGSHQFLTRHGVDEIVNDTLEPAVERESGLHPVEPAVALESCLNVGVCVFFPSGSYLQKGRSSQTLPCFSKAMKCIQGF